METEAYYRKKEAAEMTRAEIRRMCSNDNVFFRAEEIRRSRKIGMLRVEQEEDFDLYKVHCQVRGSSRFDVYDVNIFFDIETDEFVEAECSCPAYYSYLGICKHCAAAMLEWMDQKEEFQASGFITLERKTSRDFLEILQKCTRERNQELQTASGTIEIEPELRDMGEDYDGRREWSVAFKVGNTRKYVVKNLSEFAEAVKNERKISYGKQLSFLHCKSAFTEKSWKYAEIIVETNDKLRAADLYFPSELKKELPLTAEKLEQIFRMNLNGSIKYKAYDDSYDTLYILDQDPEIKICLKEAGEEGYSLEIPPLDYIEGKERGFVRIEDRVYFCTKEYIQDMKYLLEAGQKTRKVTFFIAKKDMEAFCALLVPALEKRKSLSKGKISLKKYQPCSAKIAYYLDESKGRITLKTTALYGETECVLPSKTGEDGVYHDLLKERRSLEIAEAYFPEMDAKNRVRYFEREDDDRMYCLFSTGISQLEENGSVYTTDRLKMRRILSSPKAQIGVSLKNDLLNLTMNVEEFTKEELAEALEAYKKKQKFYRLKSGDFLNLEGESFQSFGELLSGLMIDRRQLQQDVITLPKYRSCYIDETVRRGTRQIAFTRNPDYKAVIRDMKNIEDSDYEIPAGLKAELREYQKTGYRWMRTLAGLGFGGILADDMGLGKTLQTIACIQGRKNAGSDRPSLVITPASLLYNWEKELRRFAPELKVQVVAGAAESRQSQISLLSQADVCVTSYDMLKRDIDFYQDQIFDLEIIDEAQNIKNHGTQAAKTVKQIRAGARFALTGTPIENRLGELWSVFDYLMPGILGSKERFKKQYEIPITFYQEEEAAKRLQRITAPFILRRMKKDVLRELPDKIEKDIFIQMEDEQKKLYAAHAKRLRDTLMKQSGEEVKKGKLQILAELTRLRQLCCSPALVYENYKGQPCKMEVFMNLVREAVESGNKLLVFSQFTSLFPILGEALQKENIRYYQLTGETPKEKREEMASDFNTDEVPVFLISLKAGGTGLNLTGANMVIHFDPWWNIAAQNQATDRAHRIGQEKKVTVYRLIAGNSIEEKVIELQEKKKRLASQILEGEGMSAAMLTKENLMEIISESAGEQGANQ